MNGYDTNKQYVQHANYVLIESPLSDGKYDIDFDIINERNEHIKQLAQDLEDIAETSLAITQLVNVPLIRSADPTLCHSASSSLSTR